MRRGSLALRAARYFGMDREPRVSVPLGAGRTAVVATRQGRLALAVHVEHATYEQGVYLYLTDRQRRRLIEALGGSPDPSEREASRR
jgi:hypothetical protein